MTDPSTSGLEQVGHLTNAAHLGVEASKGEPFVGEYLIIMTNPAAKMTRGMTSCESVRRERQAATQRNNASSRRAR
jgi:hypothetical protein